MVGVSSVIVATSTGGGTGSSVPAAISRARQQRDEVTADDRLERRILAGTSRSSPDSADGSGSRRETAPGFGTVPGITRSRSTTSPSFGSDACRPAV